MRKVDGTEPLARARRLRREMTPQEELLWSRLRACRLGGYKFRSRHWLGPFLADFFCWEAKLIIEVDGSQHAERVGYDQSRTRWLKDRGYRVLRFWNNQVTEELDGVLMAILSVLHERVPSPSRPASQAGPLPLPEGERVEPRRRRGKGEGSQ